MKKLTIEDWRTNYQEKSGSGTHPGIKEFEFISKLDKFSSAQSGLYLI